MISGPSIASPRLASVISVTIQAFSADRHGHLHILGLDPFAEPALPTSPGGLGDLELFFGAGHRIVGLAAAGVLAGGITTTRAGFDGFGHRAAAAVVGAQGTLHRARAPRRPRRWEQLDGGFAVGDTTSSWTMEAPSKGTKLALVPNRPVVTANHSDTRIQHSLRWIVQKVALPPVTPMMVPEM